jgi:predicted dehydrogenase
MRSLLAWIATGVEPPTSARDNVATVRLVEALYRSMDTGAVQTLSPPE